MAETTLDTVDRLLQGALDDVDDTDVQYKLRSARQLLVVVKQRHDQVDEALDEVEADVDEETMERLRDLGYVD